MKIITTILLISIAAMILPFHTGAQSPFTLKGHTCDPQGEKIDYATVLLISQKDTTKVSGAVSDSTGHFALNTQAGDYTLKISFLGYENYTRPVSVSADTDLGELQMKPSAVNIKDIVVKADLITREADRFVLNVANSATAIGKTAKEMLMQAPGVWIRDNAGISINGRGGTQVMINDRLLTLSGDELTAYLNTIKAEDIQKIEVIPYAGADYDASMTGGVVKITLKRKRNDGMEGSLSQQFASAPEGTKTSMQNNPSFNLNYRYNKLSLYTTLGYGQWNWSADSRENNNFTNGNTIASHNKIQQTNHGFSGRLGAVYDIDQRQSVGVEANYYNQRGFMTTTSSVNLQESGNLTQVNSLFRQKDPFDRLSVSANYILKLDTLGSAFKLLLDYNGRNSESPSDFFSRYTGFTTYDSTYRSQIDTYNKIYTATVHFDFVLSPATTIRTGAKYSRNDMDNTILYEYLRGEAWNKIDNKSNINQYNENIGALYVNFATRFKNKIALNLGLRGEYTYAVPSTSSTLITDKQNYFGLFPNANVSFPLNKENSNMLIVGYSRKISRPSFWNLNPYRNPMSEYSFLAGNPRLQPSYTNDYSLTAVFANKYTVTAGMNSTQGAIAQVGQTDPDDPNIILYTFENIQNSANWYLSVNIPTEITKWWSLNANLTGQNTRNELYGTKRILNMFSGNMNNTFTILKNYYLETTVWYRTSLYSGNMHMNGWASMYVNLKRSFAKQRFTAAVFVDNVIRTKAKATVSEPDFERVVNIAQSWRTVGFSLRYNFKAGKTVKVKNIESGAADEKSRL